MKTAILLLPLLLFGACSAAPPRVDAVIFDRAAFALALEANNQLILSVTARDIARECKPSGDAVICKEIKQARTTWTSAYSSARTELLKPRAPDSPPFDLNSIVSAIGDLAAIGIKVAPLIAP